VAVLALAPPPAAAPPRLLSSIPPASVASMLKPTSSMPRVATSNCTLTTPLDITCVFLRPSPAATNLASKNSGLLAYCLRRRRRWQRRRAKRTVRMISFRRTITIWVQVRGQRGG
jgi:hypothetical protein